MVSMRNKEKLSSNTLSYLELCLYFNCLYFKLSTMNDKITLMRFVVVALLFYVHGKHLRSCRDGQLT